MILFWDVATGTEMDAYAGQAVSEWITSVAFSQDGKLVASGSIDKTVKLWDVATGQQRGATIKGHTAPIFCVAFSPDGKTLASAGEDSIIKLWDVASCLNPTIVIEGPGPVSPFDVMNKGIDKEKAHLKGHAKGVLDVAFSPDGKTLVSGSRDGTIKLWDVATGSVQATLKGHADAVLCVAFSPDGKTLASSGSVVWDKAGGSGGAKAIGGGEIKLWDVATGNEKATLIDRHYAGSSLAFSPDGKTLASGSMRTETGGEIKLWDVATGKEKTTLPPAHSTGCSVVFSPDGKTLASAGGDGLNGGAIKLWDMPAAKKDK